LPKSHGFTAIWQALRDFNVPHHIIFAFSAMTQRALAHPSPQNSEKQTWGLDDWPLTFHGGMTAWARRKSSGNREK